LQNEALPSDWSQSTKLCVRNARERAVVKATVSPKQAEWRDRYRGKNNGEKKAPTSVQGGWGFGVELTSFRELVSSILPTDTPVARGVCGRVRPKKVCSII